MKKFRHADEIHRKIPYLHDTEWAHTFMQLSNPDEEAAEIQRAKDGDKAAMELVCRRFARTALSVAKRYTSRDGSLEVHDVFQECMLSIPEAVSTFDPSFGARFHTHLYAYLSKYAGRYLRWHKMELYVPVNSTLPMLRRLRISQAYGDCNLPGATADAQDESEALEDTSVPIYAVGATISLDSVNSERMDIDAAVEDDGDIVYGDHTRLLQILLAFLERLNPLERDAFRLYYGIPHGESLTLTDVGRQLGYSRERIRQVLVDVKQAMRREAVRRQDMADLCAYFRTSGSSSTENDTTA